MPIGKLSLAGNLKYHDMVQYVENNANRNAVTAVTCREPEISQHGSVCERTTPTGKLWLLSFARKLE